MIASIFKKAEWGFFFIVGLISQPNIWYKLSRFPLGNDFLDLMFLSVFIGIFIHKRPVLNNANLVLVVMLLISSYIGLWNSTFRYSLPLAFTTENPIMKHWKNFAMMLGMYFLASNAIKEKQQQKALILLMSLVLFFVSLRSWRAFTAGLSFVDESRAAGPFWIIGLGSNHFGAFIADYGAVIFGLFLFDKHKLRKLFFLGTLILCLHPLFFSYSRGAYAAAFVVVVFFGIAKKRSLLVLILVLLVSWHTLLPPSVVDRIDMTRDSTSGQVESSAAARFDLWESAMKKFYASPIFGIGFYGYAISSWGEHWTDPHNYFLKKLCEEGIIGFGLLMLVYLSAFRSGWLLYRLKPSPFYQGLGFGFMGCVLANMTTNVFGDRFSYVELGSFFWIFWGLIDRAIFIFHREEIAHTSIDGDSNLQEKTIDVKDKAFSINN